MSGDVRSCWLPMFVIMAVVVPVTVLHVRSFTQISPIDELMHIDSLIKSSRPGLVRMSQTFDQEAMAEAACRRHPIDPLPACGATPYQPDQFSWEGRNLASTHSPYYYLVSGLTARALRALSQGASLVTSARLLGSAWLLGAFAVLVGLRRRFGFNGRGLVAASSLVALSPSVLHASTTVNPDATAMLAGALVAAAMLQWDSTGRGVLAVGLAAMVAVALDPSNMLGVLAGCAFIVLRAFVGPDPRAVWPRLGGAIRPLLAAVAGGAMSIVAQARLVGLLGVEDFSGSHQQELFGVARFPAGDFWSGRTFLALVPPSRGYIPPVLTDSIYRPLAAAAAVATVAALLFITVRSAPRTRAWALATAALVTMVVGGPLIVVVNYVGNRWYFEVPARYGLSTLPLAIAAIASVPSKFLHGALGTVGVGLWGAAVLALI